MYNFCLKCSKGYIIVVMYYIIEEEYNSMKKLKKNMLAVMAALSLVGTSFSPVGTINVQAEEASTPKDLYDINIEIDCSTFKYTGEAIKYLPLYYS